MSHLDELQRDFAAALVDTRDPNPAITRWLADSPPLADYERIGIYRANVIGALSRTLESNFPVCLRILGEKCFGGIAREYILDKPAEHHDLDRYGKKFPRFLAHWMKGRDGWEGFEYLPDLVRLEYLHRQAWQAPEPGRFDFEAFGLAVNDQPDRLQLQVNPSLGLLDSPWPVDACWEQHELSDPATKEIAVDAKRYFLAVHRRYDGVFHLRLDEPLFRLLEQILRGDDMGRLGDGAANNARSLDTLLPGLIADGLVTGFFSRPD